MKKLDDLNEIKFGYLRQNINFLHKPDVIPYSQNSKLARQIKSQEVTNDVGVVEFKMDYVVENQNPEVFIDHTCSTYLPLWEDKRVMLAFLSQSYHSRQLRVMLKYREIGKLLRYPDSYLDPESRRYALLKQKIIQSLAKWITVRYYFKQFYIGLDNKGKKMYEECVVQNIIEDIRYKDMQDEVIVIFGLDFMDVCNENFSMTFEARRYVEIDDWVVAKAYDCIKAFDIGSPTEIKTGYSKCDFRLKGGTALITKKKLLEKTALKNSKYSDPKKLDILDCAIMKAAKLLRYTVVDAGHGYFFAKIKNKDFVSETRKKFYREI